MMGNVKETIEQETPTEDTALVILCVPTVELASSRLSEMIFTTVVTVSGRCFSLFSN